MKRSHIRFLLFLHHFRIHRIEYVQNRPDSTRNIALNIWKKKRFLPNSIEIVIENGLFSNFEQSETQPASPFSGTNVSQWKLHVICLLPRNGCAQHFFVEEISWTVIKDKTSIEHQKLSVATHFKTVSYLTCIIENLHRGDQCYTHLRNSCTPKI